MIPTIVFSCALFVSGIYLYIFISTMIEKAKDNIIITNNNIDSSEILLVIVTILWSTLYYLTH